MESDMQFINKQTIVTLLLGVFILMIIGCDSSITTHSDDEQEILHEAVESVNQKSQSTDGLLMTDVLRDLESGPSSKAFFTDKMRKMLEKSGIDPDQERRLDEIPENVQVLWGEKAKNEFKDWQTSKAIDGFKKTSLSVNESFYSRNNLLLSSAVPAATEFEVVSISNPPASGSITVHYEGEQVTTQYTSGQTAAAVAYAIYSNINNHSQIQLTASVPETGKVLLTEKRDGCDYNGNQVYLTYTSGTHISANGDSFYMANGHDGEGWCEPIKDDNDEDIIPPPIIIYVDWNSWVNTNQILGQVAMASDTWASQPIYQITASSHSYEDGWLITHSNHVDYNANYAIAGILTYKSPESPQVLWQQYGQHTWWVNSSDQTVWYATSYNWTNF